MSNPFGGFGKKGVGGFGHPLFSMTIAQPKAGANEKNPEPQTLVGARRKKRAMHHLNRAHYHAQQALEHLDEGDAKDAAHDAADALKDAKGAHQAEMQRDGDADDTATNDTPED